MVNSVLDVSLHHRLAHLSLRISCNYHKVRPLTDLTDRRPLYAVWNTTAVPIGQMIPEKYRTPAAAVFVVAVILAVTFGSPQTEQNSFKNRGISLAGLVIFYAGLYLTSADRKRIVWRTVLVGLLCQFILALFVLRTKVGYDIFNFVSFLARYST